MSFLCQRDLDVKSVHSSRIREFMWVQLNEGSFHDNYKVLSSLNEALVDLRNQD